MHLPSGECSTLKIKKHCHNYISLTFLVTYTRKTALSMVSEGAKNCMLGFHSDPQTNSLPHGLWGRFVCSPEPAPKIGIRKSTTSDSPQSWGKTAQRTCAVMGVKNPPLQRERSYTGTMYCTGLWEILRKQPETAQQPFSAQGTDLKSLWILWLLQVPGLQNYRRNVTNGDNMVMDIYAGCIKELFNHLFG